MMRPALQLQEQGEAYLYVRTITLTSLHDREQLMQGTWDVALDFLACGLDPSARFSSVRATFRRYTN